MAGWRDEGRPGGEDGDAEVRLRGSWEGAGFSKYLINVRRRKAGAESSGAGSVQPGSA